MSINGKTYKLWHIPTTQLLTTVKTKENCMNECKWISKSYCWKKDQVSKGSVLYRTPLILSLKAENTGFGCAYNQVWNHASDGNHQILESGNCGGQEEWKRVESSHVVIMWLFDKSKDSEKDFKKLHARYLIANDAHLKTFHKFLQKS